MGKENDMKETMNNDVIYDKNDAALLIEQMNSVKNESNSIQTSFLAMINISLAVYGVILYQAFQYETKSNGAVNYFFLILPFLFAISFQNIIKYTIKILGLNAYLWHMEGVINHIYGKPLFLWHRKLIQTNGYTFIGGAAQLPCYIAMIVLLGVNFVKQMKKSFPERDLFLFLMIVELIFLSISLLICATQYHSVIFWSEELAVVSEDTDVHSSYAINCELIDEKIYSKQREHLNTRGFHWVLVFLRHNMMRQPIYFRNIRNK